ncbi:hypothetical protein BY996DRAFT_6621073 [Phakopsora pachyrhizi]|nr:hypothetical protein BY996DRAFT_6621073 [Phakopsora pachyrhizi]
MTNETRKLHHKGLLPFLTLTVTEYDSKGLHSMLLKSLKRKLKRVEGVLQTDLIDCVDLLRKGRLEKIKQLRLQTDGPHQPMRASMIAPNRLVPPFTHADPERV